MTFPAMSEPENSRPAESTEGGEPNLLELAKSDELEVVHRCREEWDRSWEDIRDLNEQWKVNLARGDGYIGAHLDKVQDRQEAVIPWGAGPSIVGLNKAARLGRGLRTNLFADDPVPEVIPNRGVDADADKAQFQSRILKDESERLSYAILAANAFEVGHSYGSGFIEFYIDPEGRGPSPVRIKAHPQAVSADDPLLEQAKAQGQPVEFAQPILRYVTADGGLTDTRYGGQPLAHQFLPALCADVLSGRHVRFLPGTARDIWDAQGALIGAMVPLGLVKGAFPKIRELDDQKLAELVSYRPAKAKDMLPLEQRRYLNNNKVTDSALVFLLKRYELPSGASKKGSYIVCVGDTVLAHAGEWWDDEHDEPLDLPIAQFPQYHQHGNGYYRGSMELLGPGNEILALMLDAMLEHLDRHGGAKTWVPTTSNVRPEQLEAETRRYIPVSPNGVPSSEQIPDFPVVIEKMHARISAELDAESQLQTAGQGLQGANVTSGRQFEANLGQVSVLLSDLRQNVRRGLKRGWSIMSQQIRAWYTIPQLLQWEGEDGAYHVKEFTGSDMVGVADVDIAQGSFTGMMPQQKAALAKSLYLEDKVFTPQEYKRIVMQQFDPILALQDDPHYQRIKRQLDNWLEGPPEGWQAPVAPVDPMTGQPQGDPQTGQPVPAPPDPTVSKVFAPLPCDEEQEVAQVRFREISRVMATTRAERFPSEWFAGLVAAYTQAKQYAQVMDAATSQKMQQDAQAQGQKLQETEAKLAAKPTVSLALKSAIALDEQQTVAFTQQAGVQLPMTGGVMEPQLDPNLELQTQAQIQHAQIGADVEKNRTTESAKIERERVKAGLKVAREESKQKRAVSQADGMMRAAQAMRPDPSPAQAAPVVNVVVPPPVEKAKRVIRGPDNKIIGTEPVEE